MPERQPDERKGPAPVAMTGAGPQTTSAPLDFLPGRDSLHWDLVPPEERESALATVEANFPIHPGQFAELVRLMEPAEIWTRSGAEIRFSWFNGDVRQTLYFLTYLPETERSEIRFVFCTEKDGELLTCFRSATDKFWCHPRLGDSPPRIVLTEILPDRPSTMEVLLVICLRGRGDDTGHSPEVHTAWVG